jgi:flavin-dependent dehydrogenase
VIYDVVIIGAGPTGLIAAKESLKYKKKVLLIDKGNEGNYPYLPFFSLATEEKILSERLGGIGGTSNSWHGQGLKFPKKYFEIFILELKNGIIPFQPKNHCF